MENHNRRSRRKVSRQSWNPGRLWLMLGGVWTAIYSVIKVAIAALATVLLIAGICAVVFVGVLGDYLEGDILPQAGVQLEGFDLNQPSYIYYLDDAGNIQVLQKLYANIDSKWAEYEEIPEALIYAAVSIEDHRFFEHQGVDWFTTIKACINMFVGSGDQFGGSSITQQLIKNMLLSEDQRADDVTVQRKVLEIFRATEFEKRYDKTVVLEWYLNYIFLGNRCTGVKAAAERYLGKELEDLTPAECACIISITNNPSIFNPISDKEVTFKGETRTRAEWNKVRRDNVLWTMRNYGYLTEEEYQEALVDSENLVFKSGVDFGDRYSDCAECGYHAHNDTYLVENGVYYCPQCGVETTIGEDASQEVYSWYVDTVINDLAADLATRDGYETTTEIMKLYRDLIAKGGYHIYTPFNMEAQNAVDKIYTNLDEIPTTDSLQQLQSGICIIDNKTGDIIAISGGVGEKTVSLAYNRATANLQPGSSIKPLSIYAPAFELGLLSPVTVVKDLPLYYYNTEDGTIMDPSEALMALAQNKADSLLFPDTAPLNLSSYPKNSNKTYSYSYSVLKGIMSSINAVAVNSLKVMGFQYSFNFAKDRFHIDTLVESYTNSNGTVMTDLAYSPLAMGAPTIGVTVRDMAEAYATFANGGVWREGRTYTHVYDTDGKLVHYNEQESEKVISEKTLTYINYCLDEAANSGTGRYGDIEGQHVAGKTGTTSSAKDRWFCGYTAYYTAAVWTGFDTPEVMNMTGSNTSNAACRLFKKVMTPLHDGKEAIPLYDGSKLIEVAICQDSGLLATDACAGDCRGSRVVYASAFMEDLPTASCDKHVAVAFCPECNAPANEYCHKYAELGLTTLTTTYLVKLTQAEVDAINLACDFGLKAVYDSDDYIYLINPDGTDGVFFGMDGLSNVGLMYPYIVGNAHTIDTWNQFVLLHPELNLPVEIPSVPGEDNLAPTEDLTEITQ